MKSETRGINEQHGFNVHRMSPGQCRDRLADSSVKPFSATCRQTLVSVVVQTMVNVGLVTPAGSLGVRHRSAGAIDLLDTQVFRSKPLRASSLEIQLISDLTLQAFSNTLRHESACEILYRFCIIYLNRKEQRWLPFNNKSNNGEKKKKKMMMMRRRIMMMTK